MHLELVIVDGPQAGRRVSLGRNPVTFGRSSAAVISFPQDSYMSGMHLSVQYALCCIIVLDLRSSNGTLLNGQRITQAMAVPGDVIKIGTMTMRLAIATAPPPEPVEPVVSPETPTILTTLEMPAVAEPMLDVVEEPVIEAIAEQATTMFVAEPVEKVHQSVLTWLLDTKLQLFCLLDPEAHESIPSLPAFASEPKESLYDGDADSMLAKFAPYVVQLGPDSELLHALVENGWGQGWACFFTSEASLEELTRHFRKFFMVQLEGGKEVYFRFYDPRVLRGFLPAGSAEELTAFFGPVVEWLLEAKNSAMMLKITNGSDGLHTRTLPLAVTASRFRTQHVP
jgi:Domain of unknown function (DUF4123)/FHA domain